MTPEQQRLRTDRAAIVRALEEAGATFTSGNACRCPFHDDHNPSGGIYQNDGGVWRFKCQTCGAGGDVFDVIAKATGKTLGDVLREHSQERSARHCHARLGRASRRIRHDVDVFGEDGFPIKLGMTRKMDSRSVSGMTRKMDFRSGSGMTRKMDSRSGSGMTRKMDSRSGSGMTRKMDSRQRGNDKKKTQAKPQAEPQTQLKRAMMFETIEAVKGYCQRSGDVQGVYVYDDADGQPVGLVVRIQTSDGKTYRQFKAIGEGRYELGAPGKPWTLYNLPAVVQADSVIICEGEKAADALNELGFCATTALCGAGKAAHSNWQPLSGKLVILWPDNDQPGRDHMGDIEAILAELDPMPTVKRLDPEMMSLQHKEDAADFVDVYREGGDADSFIKATIQQFIDDAEAVCLKKVVENAPQCDEMPELMQPSDTKGGVNLVSLASFERRSVSWLWPGRFACGKLNILASDPGMGKSFITLDMASRVSTGAAWPDETYPNYGKPGSVILLSAEDDPSDTIAPRLDAAGADTEKIHVMKITLADGKEKYFNLETDIEALRQAFEQLPDCRLCVIDPLSAYLGKTDSHKNAEVRGVLAQLDKLANSSGVAIVGVQHLNKGIGDSNPLYRVMGSLAFVAAARCVWILDGNREETDKPRKLLSAKNNITIEQDGLEYMIVDGKVQWGQVLKGQNAWSQSGQQAGKVSDALQEAQDFLIEILADGPVWRADIEVLRKEAGINKNTMDKARQSLNILAKRHGFGRGGYWCHPNHENQLPADAEAIQPT